MEQEMSRRAALIGIAAAAATGAAPVIGATVAKSNRAASRAQWEAAFADYQAKRAISDALPLDTDEGDAAVDAYCEAMDHLIEDVPAPTLHELVVKVEIGKERYEGFQFPDPFADAIIADLRRFAKREGV